MPGRPVVIRARRQVGAASEDRVEPGRDGLPQACVADIGEVPEVGEGGGAFGVQEPRGVDEEHARGARELREPLAQITNRIFRVILGRRVVIFHPLLERRTSPL